MKFSKMHGIGNDYVYVDCFSEKIENPEDVSRFVSDRRFGIGSDGLILIMPSEKADFRMRMFNADGSEGMMCGNGIRCVGKFVYDKGLTDKKEITVETLSGIKYLSLCTDDENKVKLITVDMGKPVLDPELIPARVKENPAVAVPFKADGKEWFMTCVSMGNPHTVVFTEHPYDIDIESTGSVFENSHVFPEKVNTEFVQVIDDHTLNMRVWERGSGETFACGTGACATVVASVLNGYCERDEKIRVILKGGELDIIWKSDGNVLMTGSANHVFDGEINLSLKKE